MQRKLDSGEKSYLHGKDNVHAFSHTLTRPFYTAIQGVWSNLSTTITESLHHKWYALRLLFLHISDHPTQVCDAVDNDEYQDGAPTNEDR